MTARTIRALAWGSFGLSMAFCVSAIAIAATDSPVEHPAPGFGAGIGSSVALGLLVLSFSFVGALIASRRPDNWLGWLFCLDGLLISFQNLAGSYAFHGLTSDPGSFPGAAWLALMSDALWGPFVFMTTVFLFLLFPEGRLASRGRKIAGRIALVAVVIAAVGGGLLEPTLYSYPDIPNPFGLGVSETVYGLITVPSFLVLLVVLGYAVVDLFRRLRRSVGEERLQFRWFGYATALVLIFFVPTAVLGQSPVIWQVLGGFALFTVPIAVGIAILKYRLYDIDVVVKKTVVYAILAGLIVGVGAVVILAVGRFAVGTVSDNGLVIAGAVMGFAIWPLRRLATRIADRIVFKGRETPYDVLTSFADRVAETYSSEDVLPRMAQVLAAGTGAKAATVWLRSGEGFHAAAVWPADAAAPSEIPLDAVEVRHQGEVLGALSAEMPANDPMSPAKDALIRDLASQAGLVLRNVRLIDDLRSSRRRIVTAQDERARTLERNIHDGAQQQLVALQVKLRLADATVDRDPTRTHELLDELREEANDALENLRDLARGIYPPLLADQGLAVALEAQARKAAFPVQVERDGIGRYPQEVEAAVYFCCLEALQNVAKYANAASARVRLAGGAGSVSFEVTDDGSGFDPSRTALGTGVQGMRDRLEALGGTFEIDSSPGSGTTVRGTITAVPPWTGERAT